MTLSDLAKYSMTRSVARSVCDSWTTCWCNNDDDSLSDFTYLAVRPSVLYETLWPVKSSSTYLNLHD